MKYFISVAGGVVGGIVAAVFGGWPWVLTALVIMMAIDYVSGLVVAGVFHNSPKSPNGGLESHAALKGLIRKIFVLALVVVAHIADQLLGTAFFRDSAAIAFCVYEAISILENAGLMGIKVPKVLRKAIDVLRGKAEETEEPAEKPTDAGDVANAVRRYSDKEITRGVIGGQIARATEDGTRGVIVQPAEDPEDVSGLEPEEIFGVDQGEDA